MPKKLGALERAVILEASRYPKGHDLRRAYLKAVLHSRLSMVHPTPEAREKYLKDHPNADPKNHTVAKPESDSGSPAEGQGSIKDRAQALRGAAKAKFEESLSKAKGVGDKLGKFKEPGTFAEFAELLAALVTATVFPDKGGEDFLNAVTERLKVKQENEAKIEQAMAELKAAETAALMDPDAAESLRENIGFDPLAGEDSESFKALSEWATSEGGSKELEDMPPEVKEKMLDLMINVDDDRMRFLEQFVSDGDLDVDALRAHLEEGLEG